MKEITQEEDLLQPQREYEEKKVFGMTPEEVKKIKAAIDGWTDNYYPKSQGGCFATAFREGAKLLRSDKTFLNILRSNGQD